jgi:hypothetical protein
MAEKSPTIHDAPGSLLSPEEIVSCQAIAAENSGLVSQRAAGLLAVAEGNTQVKAAEQSGLTIGQIRYLLTIFRRKGMAIFPIDIRDPSLSEVDPGPSDPNISLEPPSKNTIDESSINEKKVISGIGKTKSASNSKDKKPKDKKPKDKKPKDKKSKDNKSKDKKPKDKKSKDNKSKDKKPKDKKSKDNKSKDKKNKEKSKKKR